MTLGKLLTRMCLSSQAVLANGRWRCADGEARTDAADCRETETNYGPTAYVGRDYLIHKPY